MYGHKGANQYTKNRSESLASKSGLSKQDQEYLKAYENEIKRNQRISDIINLLYAQCNIICIKNITRSP